MNSHQSKQEIWKEHIEKAGDHPNGVSGYCRDMKITLSAFYFWRKKIVGSSKRSTVKRFLPVVETSAEQKNHLAVARPDAEWVGQVLASLVRGLR